MPSRRVPWRFRKNDIVMGIMGKTHGVKIAARPKPKATSRNAPRLWVPGLTCADGAAAARVFGGPVASAYPAGMGGTAPCGAAVECTPCRCRSGSGLPRKPPRRPPRRPASVAAQAGKPRSLRKSPYQGSAVFRLQLQLKQENRGAFVSLRIKLEVWIVSLLGRRREHPDLLHGGIRGHLDRGGNSPRAGHRIEVPARVDLALQTRQYLRSRRCGPRFQ